jgi:hypothetical protein
MFMKLYGDFIFQKLVAGAFIAGQTKFGEIDVNFTNVLQAAFAPIIFCQKVQTLNVSKKKLRFCTKTRRVKGW